jgi:hypothetical protein
VPRLPVIIQSSEKPCSRSHARRLACAAVPQESGPCGLRRRCRVPLSPGSHKARARVGLRSGPPYFLPPPTVWGRSRRPARLSHPRAHQVIAVFRRVSVEPGQRLWPVERRWPRGPHRHKREPRTRPDRISVPAQGDTHRTFVRGPGTGSRSPVES